LRFLICVKFDIINLEIWKNFQNMAYLIFVFVHCFCLLNYIYDFKVLFFLQMYIYFVKYFFLWIFYFFIIANNSTNQELDWRWLCFFIGLAVFINRIKLLICKQNPYYYLDIIFYCLFCFILWHTYIFLEHLL